MSSPYPLRGTQTSTVIESNSNRSKNFVIGNCLSCQGLVKVSATADPETLVKCPRCDETFKLYSVLDQFVPELEVVDEPSESEEIIPRADMMRDYDSDKEDKPRTKFVVPKQLAAGARKRRKGKRRRSRSSSSSSSSSTGSSSSTSRPSSSSRSTQKKEFSRSSNRDTAELLVVEKQSDKNGSTPPDSVNGSRSRSSSKKRSSSKERSSSRRPSKKAESSGDTLKLVAGGLLAIPIAYMILFWVFTKDPLNVAPAIYRAFPFAVPEVLIPEEELGEPIESSEESVELDEDSLPIPGLDPNDGPGNPDLGF